jgi:hypothetical protein
VGYWLEHTGNAVKDVRDLIPFSLRESKRRMREGNDAFWCRSRAECRIELGKKGVQNDAKMILRNIINTPFG